MKKHLVGVAIVGVWGVVSGGGWGATEARAQDHVAAVNAMYDDIAPELRSDRTVLEPLASLRTPPAAVRRLEQAILRPAGGQGWNRVVSWAGADEQESVLEAIRDVVGETDYRFAMGFGQRYGDEGVSVESVRSGMYTELGDPPTLAGARFGYLPKLDQAEILVHVEATRLASEGEVHKAVDLLVDWAFFARQLADREYFEEKEWGLRAIATSMHRVRDLLYQDFMGDRTVDAEAIVGWIERLDPRRGLLSMDRLQFSRAERLAGEQLVDELFQPSGQPDTSTFAARLARLGASEHPLRLFSEAAVWDGAATGHADAAETREMLSKVFGDWESRWPLSPHEPRMARPFEFESMDARRFAVLTAALGSPATGPGLGELFRLRQIVRTEIVGTRQSLACLGYFYVHGTFARTVVSPRPQLIQRLSADPFNPDRDLGKEPPMQFFVPGRDTANLSVPNPLQVSVSMEGASSFSAAFGEDQFVVYSVGGDGERQWAQRVQNSADGVDGTDYLIWPPLYALQRRSVADAGRPD